MAAALERLRERLTSTRPDRDRHADEINATKPRYLFSALVRINCTYDPCNFSWIEPGDIHPVTTHYYMADNLIKFTGTNDDETIPAKIWVPRPAAVIARRIIERESKSGEFDIGVVMLDELTGLDAEEREKDGELLLDIQATLLPNGLMDTGAEQVARLEGLLANGFADPRYTATCERMLTATRQAVEYSESHYADVVSALSQRAIGTLGYQNKSSREDARIITWAGYEVPQLASPMVKAAVNQLKAVPAVAPASAVPQTQCENCGAFANLLSGGRLPKMCSGCGESFTQPEVEAVTDETPAETVSRRERLQAEAQARNKGK
jgi:hypothetical protein